jgi:trehalose/maltose hydrolase-like predicted phosphorylase
VVFGFGGLSIGEDGIELDPNLPERWKRLQFGVRFRGDRVRFDITHSSVKAALDKSAEEPASLRIKGQDVRLTPGQAETV